MRFTPDHSEWWQALRLVLACLLAWGIGSAFDLKETYWALITTVVVTKPLLADTIDKGRDRMIGTIIGGVVGFFVLLLVAHGWPQLPLFWIAFALVAVVVAKVPDWRLAGITLIVVVLIPGDDGSLWRPFSRVAQILVGSLSAAAIAFATQPRSIRAILPAIAPEDDKDRDGRIGTRD